MCVSDDRARLVRIGVAINGLEHVLARALGETAARRTTDVHVLGRLLSVLGACCSDRQVDEIVEGLSRSAAEVRAAGVER